MNRIMWALPTWVHDVIWLATGRKLVKTTFSDGYKPAFTWVKGAAGNHPFDKKFPVERETKTWQE